MSVPVCVPLCRRYSGRGLSHRRKTGPFRGRFAARNMYEPIRPWFADRRSFLSKCNARNGLGKLRPITNGVHDDGLPKSAIWEHIGILILRKYSMILNRSINQIRSKREQCVLEMFAMDFIAVHTEMRLNGIKFWKQLRIEDI